MNTKIVDDGSVWVVWVNSDLTEGRGRLIPLAVCASEATARRLAKGRDTQGTNGVVDRWPAVRVVRPATDSVMTRCVYGPVVVVPSSVEDDREQARLDARAAVVAKARAAGLSDEEIARLAGR